MRFLIIFYLTIQSGWASYYGSSYSSGGYSQNNNYSSNISSAGMALNLPRIDIRIGNFISTPKEMERKEKENGVENQIPLDWYKLDEAGEIIKGKNFQKNHYYIYPMIILMLMKEGFLMKLVNYLNVGELMMLRVFKIIDLFSQFLIVTEMWSVLVVAH